MDRNEVDAVVEAATNWVKLARRNGWDKLKNQNEEERAMYPAVDALLALRAAAPKPGGEGEKPDGKDLLKPSVLAMFREIAREECEKLREALEMDERFWKRNSDAEHVARGLDAPIYDHLARTWERHDELVVKVAALEVRLGVGEKGGAVDGSVETVASGKIGFNRRVEVGIEGGCYATFTSDLADEHARLFVERVLKPALPSKPTPIESDTMSFVDAGELRCQLCGMETVPAEEHSCKGKTRSENDRRFPAPSPASPARDEERGVFDNLMEGGVKMPEGVALIRGCYMRQRKDGLEILGGMTAEGVSAMQDAARADERQRALKDVLQRFQAEGGNQRGRWIVTDMMAQPRALASPQAEVGK